MKSDSYFKKLGNKIAKKENELLQKKDEEQRIVQRLDYFKKRKTVNDKSDHSYWEMSKLVIPVDASLATRKGVTAKNKYQAAMKVGRQTMMENDDKMVQEYGLRLPAIRWEIAKLETELKTLRYQLRFKMVDPAYSEASVIQTNARDINKATVDECVLGSQFYAILRQVMQVIVDADGGTNRSIPYASTSQKSKLDKANREIEKLAHYLVQYFGGTDVKIQHCPVTNVTQPKDYTVLFRHLDQRLKIGLNIIDAGNSLQINICYMVRSKCFTCEFPLFSTTRE